MGYLRRSDGMTERRKDGKVKWGKGERGKGGKGERGAKAERRKGGLKQANDHGVKHRLRGEVRLGPPSYQQRPKRRTASQATGDDTSTPRQRLVQEDRCGAAAARERAQAGGEA